MITIKEAFGVSVAVGFVWALTVLISVL